jgi:hypothetical protein
MNRSILIVICDFLLVSLLTFSTIDISKVSNDAAPPPNLKMEITTNRADSSGKDLAAVMRVALEDERKNRDMLLGELTRTKAAIGDRERQTQTLERELQSREQQSERLQEQQAGLLQQYSAAQTNLQSLSQQLVDTSAQAVISKEKLAAMEAELRKQADQASQLQEKLTVLGHSNEMVLGEKQKLANQLQVAEVEKRAATEQAVRMEQEVKVEREEKAKLADGVKALATKSTQLAEEIRENRQLAPNAVFSEYVSNRVSARFYAVRSGLFGGDATKHKDTQTLLVTDGTNVFALCHVQDTPLTLWSPGTDWEALTGSLDRNNGTVPIHSLSFSLLDPRVVLMPISSSEARTLGGAPYRVSTDPFKFQDAVLVGAREDYYGECKFQIDLTTPEYLKLDRSFLKGLFGKFNPSKGDFVFSKTGELLGVMANSTYCLMIQNFNTAATFEFGQDVRPQHTGDALSRLYSLVYGLPFKLQ